MASASPAAARIAREHRDRSGERFERVAGGTKTPATASPNGRENGDTSGRRPRSHYHPAGGHGHAP